jgi:DNA-binding NtrC family response regulator
MRAIHRASRVREAFIGINCAAIPETARVGAVCHVRGAFTGAARIKRDCSRRRTAARSCSTNRRAAGWIAGETSACCRRRRIRRVGDQKTRKVDVRTCRDGA